MAVEFTHASYLYHVIFASLAILVAYVVLMWRRAGKLRAYSRNISGRIYRPIRVLIYAHVLALIGFGIGLLLLKPYLRTEELYIEYQPNHIVLADDKSLSVLAQATDDPCGPSRLDVAQQEVAEFMEMLEEQKTDKIGLIIFARFGYRVIPVLTRDYRLVSRVLNEVQEAEIQNGLLQGTNHWDAVLEATKIFDKKAANKKILIILTDGEPNGPEEILADRRVRALKALSELGEVSTYIVGVGDPSLDYPIPKSRDEEGCPIEYYAQTEGSETGQIVFTRPDVNELEMMSRELGGTYIHSFASGELANVMHDIVLEERVAIGEQTNVTYKDLSRELAIVLFFLTIFLVVIKSP